MAKKHELEFHHELQRLLEKKALLGDRDGKRSVMAESYERQHSWPVSRNLVNHFFGKRKKIFKNWFLNVFFKKN